MPSDPSPDAPSVLADLIEACGVDIGTMVAATAQQAGERITLTIRQAFGHGVVEGMELCAQAVELCAVSLEQTPGMAEYLRQLRDQIRVTALSAEIPTT